MASFVCRIFQRATRDVAYTLEGVAADGKGHLAMLMMGWTASDKVYS
jgi:hypothetical protein